MTAVERHVSADGTLKTQSRDREFAEVCHSEGNEEPAFSAAELNL